MDPKTILKVAKKVGLNAVAITDHNTIKGGVVTRQTSEPDLIVIVGAEISTNVGDVIGLFLSEEIKSRDLFDVIQEIRSQDGLILLPHPFAGHKLHDMISVINTFDLVEGYNARHSVSQQQLRWLKKRKKPLVAGSDAHFTQEIGLARTIFPFDISDVEDIRKSLLRKKIIVHGNPAPSYLLPISQMVKGLKNKNLKVLGLGFISLAGSCICKQRRNSMTFLSQLNSEPSI